MFSKWLLSGGLAALATSVFGQMTLYTSSTFTNTTSVANDATAVGVSTAASSNYTLWNPVTSTTTNIGGNATGGVSVQITGNGRYIGGTALNSATSRSEMSRYDRNTGAWTNFGGGGGYAGTLTSTGWGISGDGSTVFGTGYGSYTGSGSGTFTGVRALTSNGTTVTNYSTVAAATGVNRMMASNFDGSIVAGRTRYITSGTSQADGFYYWNNGVQTPLYISSTTSYLGEPTAMSSSGGRIGGSGVTNTVVSVPVTFNNATTGNIDVRRPYLFNTATNTSTLLDASLVGANGNLPAPGATGAPLVSGFLTGMSADGNTAVGFFRQSSPSFVDKAWGFIWTSTGGMQSFDNWVASQSVADASSVAASSWLLPTGISADGKTFVGSYFPRTGTYVSRGFMLTAVPEPASMAALALGVGLLARRRRKA